jgi:uncharacterized protein (TIGR02757 family)
MSSFSAVKKPPTGTARLKQLCDSLYRLYNKREYISPDPLELVVAYTDPIEREVAAFICASFAVGRVNCILSGLHALLERLPCSLKELDRISYRDYRSIFQGFRYRFFGKDETAAFFGLISSLLRDYGSLGGFFRGQYRPADNHPADYIRRFLGALRERLPGDPGILLPKPDTKSACKRVNLFLRWMVRSDAVDPGGWDFIDRARLIIPLDTHMQRIGRSLGLLNRQQADMAAACELTERFKLISPEDPVKYDFCLSRFGIHPLLAENGYPVL